MNKPKQNRKKNLKTMRRAQTRLRKTLRLPAESETIFDLIHDRIAILDRNCRIVKCNKAFADALKQSPNELAGLQCCSLIHGSSGPIDQCPHVKSLTQGVFSSSTFSTNEDTTFEVATAPRYGRNGSIIGTVHIMHDITELVRNEKKYRRQNIELKKNIDRVNEMAWKVEQASLAKTQFLGTMSHELRTPLNGVIGLSDLLLDTPLTVQQRKYAEVIRGSGEALLSLINDILDYSKIESGKLLIVNEAFDLPAAVDEVMDMAAPKAFAKNLEFTCLIDASIPRNVLGDARRIRQVLLILINNAIKFTDDGFVSVSVAYVPKAAGIAEVRFSVSDSGIGISENDLPKLFSPFTQLDGSRIRKYGGVGLGLMISKHIMELMNGTIRVESVPQKGSAFSFSLNLPKASAGPLLLTYTDMSKPLTFLCIGFGPNERTVLSHYLKEINITVFHEPSSASAIQLLEDVSASRHQIHGILLSDNLSSSDRKALMLHEHARHDHPMIFILVTKEVHLYTSTPQKQPFAAVITKPVKRRMLHECIEKLFSEKAMPAGQAGNRAINGNTDNYPAKILVAEDNEINGIVIKKALEQLGCVVDLVQNGRLAITALEHSRYRCVFLDASMPVMDGLDTLRAIRDPSTQILDHTIPIAILTAMTTRDDEIRFLDAGADYFLTKPVRREVLIDIIGTSLRSSRHLSNFREQQRHFDARELMATLDNDLELVRSILERFIADTATSIEALEDAVRDGDLSEVKKILHSIKGASLNIGVPEMAREAAVAESLEENTNSTILQKIADRIRATFITITEEIQLWIEMVKEGVSS